MHENNKGSLLPPRHLPHSHPSSIAAKHDSRIRRRCHCCHSNSRLARSRQRNSPRLINSVSPVDFASATCSCYERMKLNACTATDGHMNAGLKMSYCVLPARKNGTSNPIAVRQPKTWNLLHIHLSDVYRVLLALRLCLTIAETVLSNLVSLQEPRSLFVLSGLWRYV